MQILRALFGSVEQIGCYTRERLPTYHCEIIDNLCTLEIRMNFSSGNQRILDLIESIDSSLQSINGRTTNIW